LTPFIETLLAETFSEEVDALHVVERPTSDNQLVFVVGPKAATVRAGLKDIKRALIQRRQD
jgi:hypothetical protein